MFYKLLLLILHLNPICHTSAFQGQQRRREITGSLSLLEAVGIGVAALWGLGPAIEFFMGHEGMRVLGQSFLLFFFK